MIASRLTLLALCLFLCTCALAQKAWQDGSYTLKSGETVSGQITDTYDGRNITSLPFRAGENAEEQLIPLSTIAKFSNTTNRYIVRDIEVNTSPRSTKNLTLEANQTSSKTTGALLLLLKTSSVSLYEYVDIREQNHYFLRSSDGETTYLPYARYLRQDKNGGTRVHNYDAYKVILNQSLTGSPELLTKIQKMNYERSELISLLVAYANSRSGAIDYNRPKPASIFRFAALAAVGASDYRVSNGFSGSRQLTWEGNYTPTLLIGGAVSAVTNEQSPMRFGLELNFITSQGKTEQELPDGPTGRAESRSRDISASALQLRLGARYRILARKLPLYFEAGIIGERPLNFKESVTYTQEFGTTGRNIVLVEATGRGLYGGLSTELGRVELGLRYDYMKVSGRQNLVVSNRILLMARYGLN